MNHCNLIVKYVIQYVVEFARPGENNYCAIFSHHVSKISIGKLVTPQPHQPNLKFNKKRSPDITL